MTENRCFSPTTRQYVDNMDEHVDTLCYDENSMASLAGFTLTECTENEVVPCPTEPFWQYSPYGACDAVCAAEQPCGEGVRECEIDGVKTRSATCVKNEGGSLITSDEAAEAFECTETTEVESPCKVNCRTPLLRFLKTEGPCESTGCDVTGTVTTTYEACTSGRGCMQYAGITEAGTWPGQECPATPCDACADAPCENAESSETVDGKCICTCTEGFFGSRCHLQEGQSYSVRDSSGMTCVSMVTDMEGNCCDSGVELDGCGYCANIEVDGLGSTRVGYGIDGLCCSSSSSADVFLTGDFTCCESPDLMDECGVCKGNGDTCTKTVDGSVTTAAGSTAADFSFLLQSSFPDFIQEMLLVPGEPGHPGRRLHDVATADTVSYVLLAGSSMSTAELAGAYVATGIEATTSDPPTLAQYGSPVPTTMGVVGDNYCGSGETPENSSDCLEPISCPQAVASESAFGMVYVGSPTQACSAKGTCMPAVGTCNCNDGYVGDACDACDEANGYVLIPLNDDASTFACSTTASDHPPIPDQDVPPGTPPAAGSPPTDSKKGLGMGALIGIIVGAVGGVVVIAGVAFFVLRMRSGKEVSPV